MDVVELWLRCLEPGSKLSRRSGVRDLGLPYSGGPTLACWCGGDMIAFTGIPEAPRLPGLDCCG